MAALLQVGSGKAPVRWLLRSMELAHSAVDKDWRILAVVQILALRGRESSSAADLAVVEGAAGFVKMPVSAAESVLLVAVPVQRCAGAAGSLVVGHSFADAEIVLAVWIERDTADDMEVGTWMIQGVLRNPCAP